MSGLTEFEKREFQAGFALLDKDKDSVLSFEDLKDQMGALKFNYSDQQIQDLILVATDDKNGKIKYNDFLARFHHKDQNQLEKELDRAFEIIAGDDVKIGKDALAAFFASIGESVNDEELTEIMNMAGTDGRLSKDGLFFFFFFFLFYHFVTFVIHVLF